MIEPYEKFGMCWSCRNLIVKSYKKESKYADSSRDHIRVFWEASCTKSSYPNRATFPARFFYEDIWETDVNPFLFNVNTCSKYEILK